MHKVSVKFLSALLTPFVFSELSIQHKKKNPLSFSPYSHYCLDHRKTEHLQCTIIKCTCNPISISLVSSCSGFVLRPQKPCLLLSLKKTQNNTQQQNPKNNPKTKTKQKEKQPKCNLLRKAEIQKEIMLIYVTIHTYQQYSNFLLFLHGSVFLLINFSSQTIPYWH